MPQEIYNEGRVVGLSAWEIFVRTALGNGVPSSEIPSENKWLTSMIGSGASMILKISSGTAAGVHDYVLPATSNLSAAGVIVANPFLGTCSWDANTNTWATKVTSYSPLIQNTSVKNPPVSGDNTVPYDNTYTDAVYANCVSEFSKITDGIVFTKNANWLPTLDAPEKDIAPNFNNSSTVVRLYIDKPIAYDTLVLLTGFTNKRILQGLSGFATMGDQHSEGGSTDTTSNDWADGGMLGPEVIPWASKIVFSVPSSAYNMANSLTRTLPRGITSDTVTIGDYHLTNLQNSRIKSNSLIDFNSINLTEYYSNNTFTGTPTIQETVGAVAVGNVDSVNTAVAWYPGMSADVIASATDNSKFFPPALYATKITSTGDKVLVPLDTAAPGTVKGFPNSSQAYTYKTLMPDNYAIYYNASTNTFSFVINNESDPTKWSGTGKIAYISGDYPKAELSVGNKMAGMITLTDDSGNYYGNQGVLDGSGGTAVVGPENNLTWDTLLKSLKTNNQVDILGTKLHNLGTELKTSNTIGVTNSVTESGADKFTLTGSAPVSMTSAASSGTNEVVLASGTSIKSGTNFIEFSNGRRLYISNTDPGTTNVPEGSIGIGW